MWYKLTQSKKKQFKRKVLDDISYILEDPGSLNQFCRSSVASSPSSMIPESKTNNIGN